MREARRTRKSGASACEGEQAVGQLIKQALLPAIRSLSDYQFQLRHWSFCGLLRRRVCYENSPSSAIPQWCLGNDTSFFSGR